MGTVAGARELMCTIVGAIPWHFFYESMLEKRDKQSSCKTTIRPSSGRVAARCVFALCRHNR